MLLVQHDDVVETFSAQCPDDPIADGVGLWRVDGCCDRIDTDAPGALAKVAAIDGMGRRQR
jgi:hypothetical protein